MSFNENTRVKIPAILHLQRLGYQYVSLKNSKWDKETNIFTDIFLESIARINPDVDIQDVHKVLKEISNMLDYEDLGQGFYKKLTATSGFKLIDFNNFDNNSLHVVTELPCINGEDEFRPDITVLINGMPLAFIEVKKPNNHEGVLQERDRINTRFKNKKFRKFINITQLLVFSNNMEYDESTIEPIQGAFYATTSSHSAIFNYFREPKQQSTVVSLLPENEENENFLLKDTNYTTIKHSNELATNKDPHSPTNRILSSLFSKNRLAFILRYGIAYVKESHGLEKHIMRYPQLFATKAIEKTLEAGNKKGIIWHTQGSGKTALAFYNVRYLTDYFQTKGVIPKFYFIVDRIDLLVQAKKEFTSRGLTVHTVNSKEELLKDFRLNQVLHNNQGNCEITVVNIQKLEDDRDFIRQQDYNLNIQRVYFLDEVHRSYNPTGSFLANLVNSDRNAILIGLTGTPLIENDRKSREIFGDYIHKYYYNESIADGYTLKLIREDIETSYKMKLQSTLQEIDILEGSANKGIVFSHLHFVEPMLEYIVTDFIKSRIRFGDHSVGAMVVCDSSDQAKILFDIFVNKYNPEQITLKEVDTSLRIEEPSEEYISYVGSKEKKLTASIILHDIGDKEERKREIEDFKDGKIDLLFVHSMLLTGFDAKRLKKLYLARVVRSHNLLQTLTRVNRPYKQFQYGYVVDFADISEEFKTTNQAYLDELTLELGDEVQFYSNLFKTREEIDREFSVIKEKLFEYNLNNKEVFSQQINSIQDPKQMLEIVKALESIKNLYNVIRLEGHFDLLEEVDFKQFQILHNEASNHLALLNLKSDINNKVDGSYLLNEALENVLFMFRQLSSDEMVIADQMKDTLRKTREAFQNNFDPQDPFYISLFEELKRLFDNHNFEESSQDEMNGNIDLMMKIKERIDELNRKNDLLKAKYDYDEKYARIHKRMTESGRFSNSLTEIQKSLLDIKYSIDDKVLRNKSMLENEGYFAQLMKQTLTKSFRDNKFTLDVETTNFINGKLVKEYMDEFERMNNVN